MIDRESGDYHQPLRSSSWYLKMLLMTAEVEIAPTQQTTTPQQKGKLEIGSAKKSGRVPELPLRGDHTPPKNSIRKGRPSKSHEASRSQWLGRTGYSGPQQSVKFKYGPHGEYTSADAAENACAKWLANQERIQGYA